MSQFKTKKGPFKVSGLGYVSFSTVLLLQGIEVHVSSPTKEKLKTFIENNIVGVSYIDAKKFKKTYLIERKPVKGKKLGIGK